MPASAGHAAGTANDTGPSTVPGVPSGGTMYGAGTDQMAGKFGGHVEVTSSSGGGYSGSHAVGSHDTASYGTAAEAASHTASHTTASFGTGSYGSAYGAAAGGHAAPDAGWVPQDATNGRPAEETWQDIGPAEIGGPAGAAPMSGYSAPAPNGYAAAFPASTPATPAGGIPRAQGGNSVHGYPSPPHAGGFASGYLSSSALSARHGVSGPEPLANPGSGNPYGGYVAHPANPAGESAIGASPRWQPRHSDTRGSYDPQRSYGGYGDYGGGSRR